MVSALQWNLGQSSSLWIYILRTPAEIIRCNLRICPDILRDVAENAGANLRKVKHLLHVDPVPGLTAEVLAEPAVFFDLTRRITAFAKDYRRCIQAIAGPPYDSDRIDELGQIPESVALRLHERLAQEPLQTQLPRRNPRRVVFLRDRHRRVA